MESLHKSDVERTLGELSLAIKEVEEALNQVCPSSPDCWPRPDSSM